MKGSHVLSTRIGDQDVVKPKNELDENDLVQLNAMDYKYFSMG